MYFNQWVRNDLLKKGHDVEVTVADGKLYIKHSFVLVQILGDHRSPLRLRLSFAFVCASNFRFGSRADRLCASTSQTSRI